MIEHNVLFAGLATVLAASATLLGALAIVRAKEADPRVLAFGLAFAGGAMVYISLVEIFLKSQMAFAQIYSGKDAYTAATLAFFAGCCLLVILDRILPNPHGDLHHTHDEGDGHSHKKSELKAIGMMTAIAITAHNLPEGMATFFSTLSNPGIGGTLAFAIAVHNIPEGLSIAIPVYYATGSRKKAFLATFISAIAEPVGAFVGYVALAPFLSPFVYGSVFGVIAGAMVYLSLDELLPAAKKYAKGHETVYGMISGMGIIALSLVLFR